MKTVALFGAGRIGRIHGANLASLPGVRLKVVCDPMPDAAVTLLVSESSTFGFRSLTNTMALVQSLFIALAYRLELDVALK